MKHLSPIETRSALPVETRQDPDPLAEATQAVTELRASVTDHHTRQSAEVTALTERLAALETRANRPGTTETTTGQPEEMRHFLHYARRGTFPEGQENRAAIDSGTAGAGGGYTVPETFVTELLRNIVNFSPIRSVARVISITGDSVKLPKRTGTMTAACVDEGDDSTETNPTFAQVNVPAHTARCFTTISNALLEDSALDLAGELAFDAAEEFGRLEGKAFLTGNGTGQPTGPLADTTIQAGAIPTGAAATLGTAPADLLISMFYALKPFYRSNATWGMNGTTLAALRKLKDTTGQYLWQPALVAGQPETVLGRPVLELPDMADVGAGAFPIILGDFAQGYRICGPYPAFGPA